MLRRDDFSQHGFLGSTGCTLPKLGQWQFFLNNLQLEIEIVNAIISRSLENFFIIN
jgi:hypothetical protein